MDLMLQNSRFIGILADLEVPPLQVIESALQDIAHAGPHTRVALVPGGSKRWWHTAEWGFSVVRIPTPIAEAGTGRVLEYIRNRPGERKPLEVHVSDRHIAVDAHHGLGDGRLFVDLVSALFAHSVHTPAPWVTTSDTRAPALRALITTFVEQPRRLRPVLEEIRSLRATHPPDPEPDWGPSVSWSPASACELAFLTRDAEAEVEAWRRAEAPDCGAGAVWLYAVRRAFVEAGLPMTGRVQVAFDCRRYLPRGATANGNFATGIELSVDVDKPVSDVGARMRRIVASGLPVALMGAAASYVQLRPRLTEQSAEFVPGVPARIMFSDMGRPAPFEALPWRNPGRPSFAGLLNPDGPDGVSVLNAMVKGERTLTISYHENVFDRSVMRRAAKLLENEPLRLIIG